MWPLTSLSRTESPIALSLCIIFTHKQWETNTRMPFTQSAIFCKTTTVTRCSLYTASVEKCLAVKVRFRTALLSMGTYSNLNATRQKAFWMHTMLLWRKWSCMEELISQEFLTSSMDLLTSNPERWANSIKSIPSAWSSQTESSMTLIRLSNKLSEDHSSQCPSLSSELAMLTSARWWL